MENEINVTRLKVLETELKQLNKLLMKEKRKTYRLRLKRTKRKLLKQIKQLKAQLVKLHNSRQLDIWNIDITAISILGLKRKKQRYLKYCGRYYNDKNLLIAYNFSRMYGYAILTRYAQITRKDLEKLLSYLPQNSEVVTDNRHKYTNTVTKALTQPIERLFAWIKKSVYADIKDKKIDIKTLMDKYLEQLEKWDIRLVN